MVIERKGNEEIKIMKSNNYFLSIIAALLIATGLPAQSLLLRHANVLTMETPDILMDYDVFIKDGKIHSIKKTVTDAIIPDNTKVIDVTGKFLMPGLIDMHVHLFDESELLTNLSYGVTTVLNMDGTPDHLAWREKSKSRNYTGARIFTAGHTLDGYPALNWMFWALQTPEQARAAVRKQKKDGYDFIKIYGTLNPDVFEAIQDEAKKQGLSVAGHVPRQVGIEKAIKKNYSLIAHGDDLISSYFNSIPTSAQIDSLALLISKGNTYLTPNLSIQKRMLDEATDLETVLSLPENRYVSPPAYSQWIKANNRTLDQYDLNGYKNYLQEMQKYNRLLTLACKKYGVKMVAGTDCATLGFPGSSLFSELSEMVTAGLSNYEALHTATNVAGEYVTNKINPSVKLGKIKAGYMADLIIVTENPLENILTVKTPAAVITKGIYYTRDNLDKMLTGNTVNFSSIKKRIEAADSLLESADAGKGLQILQEESVKHPAVKIYAQWVLGIKAMRLQNKSPEKSFLVRKANAGFYPSHFSVFNELAFGYYASKHFDSAMKYFMQSNMMAPSNAVALIMMEKIKYALKDFIPLLKGNYTITRISRTGEMLDSITLKITLSEQTLKQYLLSYSKNGNWEAVTKYEGGSDRIWFSIPGNYGETEYCLWLDKQKYGGQYWGSFGNNGQLRVNRKE